jgi:hypothetical protein
LRRRSRKRTVSTALGATIVRVQLSTPSPRGRTHQTAAFTLFQRSVAFFFPVRLVFFSGPPHRRKCPMRAAAKRRDNRAWKCSSNPWCDAKIPFQKDVWHERCGVIVKTSILQQKTGVKQIREDRYAARARRLERTYPSRVPCGKLQILRFSRVRSRAQAWRSRQTARKTSLRRTLSSA